MADFKARPDAESVEGFLRSIEDEKRRGECQRLVEMVQHAPKAPPGM